jgi:peptide chain release factor 3
VSSDDKAALKDFFDKRRRDMAKDKDGREVFLAESQWMLQMAKENFPKVEFHFKSEF